MTKLAKIYITNAGAAQETVEGAPALIVKTGAGPRKVLPGTMIEVELDTNPGSEIAIVAEA